MKPVNQTICGDPFGNCLQASVASYFELELDRVPNFMLFGDDYYWEAFYWFVRSLGYELMGYVEQPPPNDGNFYIIHIDFGDEHKSSHAAIWKDGKIVHDPSPLKANQDDPIKGYYEIKTLKP